MSRRRAIAMTRAEIDNYLARELTVIVVSNGANGYPHPMPMHFCIQTDGCIAMTTYKKSQKVINLRRDARAALIVESGARYDELRSVLIYADAEIIDDHAVTLACMQACREHSNSVRGDVSNMAEDAAFAASAANRAHKRLLLKFHPRQTISWDHAKLGGRY